MSSFTKKEKVFFWKTAMLANLTALLIVALFHENSDAPKIVTIGMILWNVIWGLLALFQLDRLQKVGKDETS